MSRAPLLLIGLVSGHTLLCRDSYARPPLSLLPVSESPRLGQYEQPKQNQAANGGGDSCQTAETISGTGVFNFNNTSATLDGPSHAACTVFGQSQIDHDVWYCWTAPAQACNGSYSVSTCGRTNVDTKIAVYSGCGCPTDDANLLNCRDDECETQTRLSFNPVPGQQYLIRLGTFPGEPGGTGTFLLNCDLGPPCDEPISHCQSQDQSDALNSNRTGFVAADGFTPTQSGNVNSVCWWGAYLNNTNQNCEATSTDTFRIRYFDDAGGLPGAEIASFSQQASTLTLEAPFSTGLLINGVAPEYEFHATHPDLPVTSGDCFWIEISNQLTNCTWFWELGLSGDGRAIQDDTPQDPYTPTDTIVADLAFCVSVPLATGGQSCLAPAPSNDQCADATPITGTGVFSVDTSAATSAGPNHAACLSTGQSGIDHDVWHSWTSTCSGDVVVRTCNTTAVDSKVAVYSGTICPTAANDPLGCNDDLCGSTGLQSMLVFPATINQQFLIRVGSFPGTPGGVIGLVISCGPPDNPACGAGSSNTSCCTGSATDSGGCGDETCCELVCACDPFCCETEWDAVCAANGLGNSGCGAGKLCNCSAVCGGPTLGDCCTGHATPGCSDAACCEAVCQCDPFCCDTEWDANCAGDGFVPGCGAASLCSNICNPACDAGNPCPDDGLECTEDICVGGICQHPPVAIGTPCGNQTPQGPCDLPDACDDNQECGPNLKPPTSVCRTAANVCDLEEHCSGSSADCPTNGFNVAGTSCEDDGDLCTNDRCDGLGQCTHSNNQLCGACCRGPFECVNGVLADECPDGFHLGEECAGVNCDVIPTVSEWGLIAIVLSLLVMAKIVFSRPITKQLD
jgi:hypothetical protein